MVTSFHLASIVEGHGEVQALRVLIHKLFPDWQVSTPIRCTKGEITEHKPRFVSHLKLAQANIRENGADGLVLVLIDADDDCPAEISRRITPRVSQEIESPSLIAVAKRCYESWLIAGNTDFNGNDPECLNGKRWIKQRDPRYNPRIHQPGYTSRLDIDLAIQRSRSFAYLCSRLKTLTSSR